MWNKMKRINSVGGYRIYPSSPGQSDAAARGNAILGRFREGMDRLYHERNLSESEQSLIGHMGHESEITQKYQKLQRNTETLWNIAIEKQQARNRGENSELLTMAEIGERLLHCANRWALLKETLKIMYKNNKE